MKKIMIKPNRPIFISPIALVSSIDDGGNPNIMTVGEVFNLSNQNPVIIGIGIRKATYTHTLISSCREFVVNLASPEIVDKVDHGF